MRRTLTTILLLAFGFSLVATSAASPKQNFGKANLAFKAQGRVAYRDIVVGNRGFIVVAWIEKRRSQATGEELWLVFTRDKKPGVPRLSGKKLVGIGGKGYLSLEIGTNDLVALTWSGQDGFLRYSFRYPRSAWTETRKIEGSESLGALVSVGEDGTVIATDLDNRGNNDPNAKVQIAVRMPGSDFQPWRTVASGPSIIGFDADSVARRDGAGTLVWGGTCPVIGAATNAYYIDIDGETNSEPRMIENSDCVVSPIDLATDRFGNEYLRVPSYHGLRYASRKAGQPFPRMTSIQNRFNDEGDLVVNRQGRVTLIWSTQGSDGIPTAYRYATAIRTGPLSAKKTLRGPVLDPRRARDLLVDSAPLPNGAIANLWVKSWSDKEGYFQRVFGPTTWRPGAPYVRAPYRYHVPRDTISYPTEMLTAPDGTQLLWWGEEDESGRLTNLYFALRERSPKSR